MPETFTKCKSIFVKYERLGNNLWKAEAHTLLADKITDAKQEYEEAVRETYESSKDDEQRT